MTIDIFKVATAITAEHCKRKGYRDDLPSDANAEETALAIRSLDVATAIKGALSRDELDERDMYRRQERQESDARNEHMTPPWNR